jgi:pyruvate/2-oxoglutarate dehydrogenase complex dihydrolipoamide acyltransferase (E2) component
MTDDLLGVYRIEDVPFARRLTIEAFDALPAMHSMTAFMELDVSRPSQRISELRERGVHVSLFSHVVRSVAVALSEHPELNVVRHGRRIARFEDVDVSVPVEVKSGAKNLPLQMVIRRAQDKLAPEIYSEIAEAKARFREHGALGEEDRWARRLLRMTRLIPRFVRRWLIRRIVADARRVKRRSGTTLVTSVGKFARVPGFVTTFAAGPRATSFALGSVVDKAVVRDGQVVVRAILSLTCIFDHDVVDGSPAARFASRLQELVEDVPAVEPQPSQVKNVAAAE